MPDLENQEFREAGLKLWRQWSNHDNGESTPEILARAMKMAAQETWALSNEETGTLRNVYEVVASRISSRIKEGR